MRIANPNPNRRETKKPKENYGNEEEEEEKKQQKQYEFCKVCRLNHDQGRRHVYFPNHKKALSLFLSRFQSKLTNDVVFFLKNPIPLRPEHAFRNRLWCIFCDCDILEAGSAFACASAIAHFASTDHLKEVKAFFWKNGGEIERVDSFLISESDFAKWEKKCKSLKAEATVQGSHGQLNDIHNERNSNYVNSLHKDDILSSNLHFNLSNGVMPLQNHTDEISHVLHSEISGVTENRYQLNDVCARIASGLDVLPATSFSDSNGDQNFMCILPGDETSCRSFTNGAVYSYERITNGESSSYGISNGECGSQGFQNLTQISLAPEDNTGNVHSGAPPPWFCAAERNNFNAKVNSGASSHVSSLAEPLRSSKLNPKRVGAAWAERRKMELEMEKRGEFLDDKFGSDWLPNFGRIWQSGSRKESRKEFQVENKSSRKAESQLEKPMQLEPYISKRMRRDEGE